MKIKEMRKKKKNLIVIIIAVLVILPGIVFLGFQYKNRSEKSEDIPDTVITELDEQDQTIFNTALGQQVKTEQQEEKNVLIVKDEKVLEDCVFVAFINNEVSTYDLQENNEKYLRDYLKNYHMIYGIHYMAEDLNNDNENELLILIQTGHDFGDLLVFEEAENGKFITWDIWEDFLIDRLCEVYYCGNATFERIGGLGISIGHYTQEGKQECLMDFYTETREYYDTYDVEGVWLRLYENGEVVNEIDYEYYYDRELDEHRMPLENKAKETKCDELVDAMLATLGEEKAIKVQSEEYRDKIETVSLEELLNP